MTSKKPLILYTRVDCHLCHQVIEMLAKTGVAWRPVDIDDDPRLAEKYGVSVPVLAHQGSTRELYFPFNEETLVQFVAAGP